MFLFSSFQLSCCMQSGVPMVSNRMKLNKNTKKEKVQETTASRSGLPQHSVNRVPLKVLTDPSN
jgi:hypothetical protein